MQSHKDFVRHIRGRFLDAVNNHLMHIDMAGLEERFETREDLIKMLSLEAEYLKKKRDVILAEIQTYLERA